MIKYEQPAENVTPTGNFTRFNVWGTIVLPSADPNLANFWVTHRIVAPYQYAQYTQSASAMTQSSFGYNLTGGGGRNSFRNHVANQITNIPSVLGAVTITNNVTLFYGTTGPGITLFEFLITGTCFRLIPNAFLFYEQIEDPNLTGQYIVPFNNNAFALIYED